MSLTRRTYPHLSHSAISQLTGEDKGWEHPFIGPMSGFPHRACAPLPLKLANDGQDAHAPFHVPPLPLRVTACTSSSTTSVSARMIRKCVRDSTWLPDNTHLLGYDYTILFLLDVKSGKKVWVQQSSLPPSPEMKILWSSDRRYVTEVGKSNSSGSLDQFRAVVWDLPSRMTFNKLNAYLSI